VYIKPNRTGEVLSFCPPTVQKQRPWHRPPEPASQPSGSPGKPVMHVCYGGRAPGTTQGALREAGRKE